LDEVVDEVKSGMSLITAGKTNLNPVLLLGSTRMNQLMDELKDRFDLIVIDAPPLADFQDGYLLSSLADKTLLVVSENRTRRQVAAKVVDAFGGLKEKILGVILNRRLYSIPNWLYQQL
ncbi:MAG: hypothetical protein KGJ11_09465, partial [Candidatus Omnitrophica bacterium]|nr:hypothetical protein [Candidatus Omnitrophota bacterium]